MGGNLTADDHDGHHSAITHAHSAHCAGVWINQQIDNNFLTPTITGSRVAINPLATIIILIIGGYIWGVAGMVLFIPLLGVAKIVFDNVEGLKPLGYLIGDDSTGSQSSMKRWFTKLRKK